MEAGVFIEFGVEGLRRAGCPGGRRRCGHRPLPSLGVAVHFDDAGRADKRQRHFTVDAGYLPLGSKAAELPAVGIALDEYIHGCQTRRALSS